MQVLFSNVLYNYQIHFFMLHSNMVLTNCETKLIRFIDLIHTAPLRQQTRYILFIIPINNTSGKQKHYFKTTQCK